MSYQSSRPRRLLTADEEVRLAKRIEAGKQARARRESGDIRPGDERAIAAADRARTRFIEANLRLALKMARRAPAPAHVDRDDMIQDAMCGLERAVDRFDWRKGNRFSTYAGWWIRLAMQQGLETAAAPVRIPMHASRSLYRGLRSVDGNVERLPASLAATLSVATMASLDQPHDQTGSTLAATVPGATADPHDLVERRFDRAAAARLVAELDDVNRYVVIRRFGLDGGEPATFGEIAEELAVSAEAVRRRVQRTLAALRPRALELAA